MKKKRKNYAKFDQTKEVLLRSVAFRKLTIFVALNSISEHHFIPAATILTLITANIHSIYINLYERIAHHFLMLYKTRSIWIKSRWDYFSRAPLRGSHQFLTTWTLMTPFAGLLRSRVLNKQSKCLINCSFLIVFFRLKQSGDTNEIASTMWQRMDAEYSKLRYISIYSKTCAFIGWRANIKKKPLKL